jgi:chromosome partitioning protein
VRAAEDEYDYVILDCPPGLGLLTENVLRAADRVVVPLKPSTLSMRTLEQLDKFCAKRKIDVPLSLFFSMVDRRKSLHVRTIEEMRARRSEVLSTTIPYSSTIEQMGIRRAPVQTFARTSPAAMAYADLWREIVESYDEHE